MAYPIAPSEGFVRTPAKYPHDAFGADTGGRVRPHTGLDTTPTVANARNLAVLSGVVTRVGFSPYTGNYVEIRDSKNRYWLTFHQRQNLVSVGAIVAEGAVIGYTGNTGGGGALGALKIGVHNHTSLCVNQAAATRLITGQVRARYKGETTEQWANDRGLLDPWPIIRDGDKDSNPKPQPERKGLFMYLTEDQEKAIYNALIAEQGFYKTDAILNDQRNAANDVRSRLSNQDALMGKLWDSVSKQQAWELMPQGWTYNLYFRNLLEKIAQSASGGSIDVAALAQELSKQDIQVQAVIPEDTLAKIVAAAREGGAEAVENLELVTVVKK